MKTGFKENVVKHDMCIGCGLCTQIDKKLTMKIDRKGFLRPTADEDADWDNACMEICPVQNEYPVSDKVWGPAVGVYRGHSVAANLRTKASSGGVISQMAIYLLETQQVDGVIQIGVSKTDPLRNDIYVSRSREEIIHCAGSRYAPAAPLAELQNILDENAGEKFVFIGKPCDVRALRYYQDKYPDAKERIPYVFSFFCAGTPSILATDKVLDKLEVEKHDLDKFQYRGNGWPGYATATQKDGQEKQMTYDDSWGKILGRNIQRYCRLCFDGIGELADVACADAWYLDENRKPVFTEGDGRNLVIARNSKGQELLKSMQKDECLVLEEYKEYQEELRYIQKYQYERRATMPEKIRACKLCGCKVPGFRKKELKAAVGAYIVGHKRRFKIFLGTVQRLLKNKY